MEIGGSSTHFRPPPFARGLPSFEDVDADASGGISLEEYTDAAKTRRHGRGPDPERLEKRFARIDGDADGSLSSDELSAFRARFLPATGSALIDAQAGDKASSETADKPALEDRLADLFAKLDADGDGALRLSELVAAVNNLPGGKNGQDEDASEADAAASDDAPAGSDAVADAAVGGVAAGMAVEESAQATDAAGAGTGPDAAAETSTGVAATAVAADASGEGEADAAESPRDRWRARLEAWSERFGDAWQDRFADRAERWHDRWADRLADRAERWSDRAESWRDRWAERTAAGGTDAADASGPAGIAGALRELVALLREALGTDSGTATDTGTAAGETAVAAAGGTDAGTGTAEATATADAGSAGSGKASAAGTPTDTASAGDAEATTEAVALGGVAIDRLAALLASRIEAYLKAGTQNAQAGSSVTATA